MKIKKNLVPSSRIGRVSYKGTNSKKYIVIHETDNTNIGANADAHSRLQYNGNRRKASWHYQVDDKEIIQSFDDNVQCWGAGSKYYNQNGIQIEICVNSDGDYEKAVKNAAWLVNYLMNKYNIPLSRVIQHNNASGKNCPRNLRSGAKGIYWSQFKLMVTKSDSKVKETTPKKNTPKPSNNNVSSNKTDYKVGDKVKIKTSAGKYSRSSLNIPSQYKNKTYTIQQVGANDVLIKELYSWVRKSDLVGHTTINNTTTKPKPQPKPTQNNNTLKVGSKVKIKSSAKTYSRSTVNIPSKFKNKTYTVQQVGKNDVLIKELYSWVRKSDLVGHTTTSSASKPKPRTFKVGQTVTVKRTAKRFATGQTIAPFVKGSKYKILQVKSDRVLLDGIMSWVRKTDVQ